MWRLRLAPEPWIFRPRCISQGSKSQVIVAGATASLSPESTAQVHNDPKADQHEILMKKGTGEVTRGGETVKLANWEKVSFQGTQSHLEKAKEIGPPTPIAPANMAPLFSTDETDEGRLLFLDRDGECSWLPSSYLPQSLFFFYTG